MSTVPSVLLDLEPQLCDLDWFFISIFAIELLVLLVLACSSIACRNYPSGLVDRAPQDRDAIGGGVSVAKAQHPWMVVVGP